MAMGSAMVRFVANAARVAAALAATAVGACSSSEEPGPDPVEATLRSKFEGQAIAILPFEPTNSACAKDPYEIDRVTFAACAHLDLSKLPENVAITKEVRRFDPKADSPILVIQGRPLDPAHPEVSWQAVVGLGPVPAEAPGGDTSLVKSAGAAGIRPRVVPALVVAAPSLLQVGGSLLAVAAAWYGGRAVVATSEILSNAEADPIIEAASASVELLARTDKEFEQAIKNAEELNKKDTNCDPNDDDSPLAGRSYAQHCAPCGLRSELGQQQTCIGVDPLEKRTKRCTCKQVPAGVNSEFDHRSTEYWDCRGGDPAEVFRQSICEKADDSRLLR
jgi:hypothetical protein